MKATQGNGKKGMFVLRNSAITLATIFAFSNIASAQEGLYLKGGKKNKMTVEFVTAQSGNGIYILRGEERGMPKIANAYEFTNDTIAGDNYLKTTEDSKKYTTLEVYDVKKVNKQDMMMGFMTDNIDRGIRYNEKSTGTEKITLTATPGIKMHVIGMSVKQFRDPGTTEKQLLLSSATPVAAL